MTLVLTRTDVLGSLDADACIAAVEDAFRAQARGMTLATGVLAAAGGLGTFHVKTAGIVADRSYYAAKINGNFPGNSARNGSPTIRGVVCLCDADSGAPLALLDSSSITALRTAAATAIAAKHLARRDAASVAVAGCGAQSRSQLRALSRIRSLARVTAYDLDSRASERFAVEMRNEVGCDVRVVGDFRAAAARADIIVTCTTARRPILSVGDVRPGTFVAAVGADSPDKQELEPELLAHSKVVVDSLEQCVSFGELHHAVRDGLMSGDDVHATLAEVVAGARPGRESDGEITIFDSTGTGLEDVAAAAAAYERAVALGLGREVRLDE